MQDLYLILGNLTSIGMQRTCDFIVLTSLSSMVATHALQFLCMTPTTLPDGIVPDFSSFPSLAFANELDGALHCDLGNNSTTTSSPSTAAVSIRSSLDKNVGDDLTSVSCDFLMTAIDPALCLWFVLLNTTESTN